MVQAKYVNMRLWFAGFLHIVPLKLKVNLQPVFGELSPWQSLSQLKSSVHTRELTRTALSAFFHFSLLPVAPVALC